MIARERLEKRRDAMLVRSGALALDRIEHEKRLVAIDEEARQIGVLLKVFDATLADLGADEEELAALEKRLERIEALQDAAERLRQHNDSEEEAKALAATDEGNMDEDVCGSIPM